MKLAQFTDVRIYWSLITYPLPKFNGCTVEVWNWKRNFIPQFTVHVIFFHAVIKLKHVITMNPWWKYTVYDKTRSCQHKRIAINHVHIEYMLQHVVRESSCIRHIPINCREHIRYTFNVHTYTVFRWLRKWLNVKQISMISLQFWKCAISTKLQTVSQWATTVKKWKTLSLIILWSATNTDIVLVY